MQLVIGRPFTLTECTSLLPIFTQGSVNGGHVCDFLMDDDKSDVLLPMLKREGSF